QLLGGKVSEYLHATFHSQTRYTSFIQKKNYMEKIFLKNYKGFRNQIIELEDINFLVGENSTGKTSILKIINLLSSAEFRFDFEFNNSEVELGYFDEIISKNITEKFILLA